MVPGEALLILVGCQSLRAYTFRECLSSWLNTATGRRGSGAWGVFCFYNAIRKTRNWARNPISLERLPLIPRSDPTSPRRDDMGHRDGLSFR